MWHVPLPSTDQIDQGRWPARRHGSGRDGNTGTGLPTLASVPQALQIDHRIGQAIWMLPSDMLYGVGDRGEVVGGKCRRDEHDPGVFEIRGDELPGQLGEIPDVACDDGAAGIGGIAELAAVVEPRVADLMSADNVESASPQDLDDPRRQVLVEVERHPEATTRTSPG